MLALLIPLGLMLHVGFRIILLILNDGKLPWWLKFIYKKAKETVRNTQSWLRAGIFCHSALKFRMNFVLFLVNLDPEYVQRTLQEIQLTDMPKPQQEPRQEPQQEPRQEPRQEPQQEIKVIEGRTLL
jgi:hypothetical protein